MFISGIIVGIVIGCIIVMVLINLVEKDWRKDAWISPIGLFLMLPIILILIYIYWRINYG